MSDCTSFNKTARYKAWALINGLDKKESNNSVEHVACKKVLTLFLSILYF